MKRPILIATAALLTCILPAVALQIFVSNEKDNTVTVIDGKTLEVIKTIPTARRPRGIIASPDGKEVYVAAGDGDIMDVIDTSKLEITRQLESGPDPELMAVDPKGGTLYIANEDNSMVTVMDTASGDVKAEIPVGVEPEGMDVSPDSKYTVATSESTSMAHVIDNATEKLIANVLVDTRPREAPGPSAANRYFPSLVNSMPTGWSSSGRTPGTSKRIFLSTFQVRVADVGTHRRRQTIWRYRRASACELQDRRQHLHPTQGQARRAHPSRTDANCHPASPHRRCAAAKIGCEQSRHRATSA